MTKKLNNKQKQAINNLFDKLQIPHLYATLTTNMKLDLIKQYTKWMNKPIDIDAFLEIAK
jgi:hypothetical protein